MANKISDIIIFRRLLGLSRPFWGHIAVIFLVSLLSTPLALLTPLPLKIVIDSVIGSHPLPGFLEALLPASISRSGTNALILALTLLLTISILIYLQSIIIWVLQTYTGEKLALSFRSKLFRHAQRLSLAHVETKGTTDIIYRIQYDATSIQSVMLSGLMPFITSAFTLAGMIYVTAVIDWQLALIALVILPPLFILTKVWRRRLRDRWETVKDSESSAISIMQEVLAAIRVVKAFGSENFEENRFINQSGKNVRLHIRLALLESSFDFLVGLTIAFGTMAVILVGVIHIQQNLITLGQLLMVMAYLAQIYKPIETISKNITQLQSSFVSAERAFSLLDEKPAVAESPEPKPLARALGKVAFENVSFEYGENRPALSGISFKVEPGMRVGITGKTGSGKTTLISLLIRFYDPTAGRILLDDVDLREYSLTDLRSQFSIMLQEPVLFSTTIAENIAYANPSADESEIIEAAKAANAHDFIIRLPDGYQTQVGERGARLSGGERQRISLARAFLKNAPLLILDEPTSSVDYKTESAIMEAIGRLMHGRTTFIIAHRLSTLNDCDLRLHLEQGNLTEIKLSQVKAAGNSAGLAEQVF
jgi:ATP-binding cassette, subfamily B, bacterial